MIPKVDRPNSVIHWDGKAPHAHSGNPRQSCKQLAKSVSEKITVSRKSINPNAKLPRPASPKPPEPIIEEIVKLDYNKFSPTFGKYIIKKSDQLLRERNPSIYAPQYLDTELSYLQTGLPLSERNFDGERIISYDKAATTLLSHPTNFPRTFATLNGDYIPGCKKKRTKNVLLIIGSYNF